MKKVLLIDDHDIVRFGLKSIIQSIGLAVDIFEVANVEEAKVYLRKYNFDLVISDQNLPDGKGLDLIDEFSSKHPFVVFSMFKDKMFQDKAIKHGAIGLIPKCADPFLISKLLKDYLLNGFKSSLKPDIETSSFKVKFSLNEQKVFDHLLDKKSLKEISSKMSIAYSTVYTYRNRIYKKLEIDSQKEFIELCLRYNLM